MPVVPQLLGDLAGLRAEGAAEGLLAAGEPHGRAGVQDGGDGALGDHQARAGAGVEDDAGAAPGEVKADLAGLVVLGLSDLTVQRLAGAEDRGVQGGAPPGGEDRAEQGIVEGSGGLAAVGGQPPGQLRPADGEGAGLVGAQHVHAGQVLHRARPGDDDAPAGECGQATAVRGGQDNRQHLRHQADRDGDGEQGRAGPVAVVVGQHGQDEHGRHQGAHEPDKQPGHRAEPQVGAGGPPRLGDLAGGGGQDGVRAGLGDHGGGRARGDRCAGQAQHRRVQHAGGPGGPRGCGPVQPARLTGPGIGGELGDGHRLAGEGGLVQGEPISGHDAAVRGDHIPGAEQHQVAGCQQPRVPGPGDRAVPGTPAGAAQDGDPGCGKVAQAGEQVVEAARVVQPQPEAGRHHRRDQGHTDRVAGERHDRVQDGQQQHERAAHAGQQRRGPPGGKLVDAVLFEAAHHLDLGQARLAGAEAPQRLGRGAGGQGQQIGGGRGPAGVEQRIVRAPGSPEGEGAARAQCGVHPASSLLPVMAPVRAAGARPGRRPRAAAPAGVGTLRWAGRVRCLL